MALMLVALLLFSLWLPAPLLEVMQQAARHHRRRAMNILPELSPPWRI